MNKLIGDKKFYRSVLSIAVPIIIQNVITNFVNLLDNLMVGRVGTEQMSGVAIVNQLLFVFNLGIFGMLAGIGIYTAQYYGKKDNKGIGYTMRLSLIAILIYLGVAYFILIKFGDNLILNYLHGESAEVDAELTFMYAKQYLQTIFIGLVPFALSQVYSSILRSVQETKVPMVGSVTAVVVNLCLNYVLIYGKFGAPTLGVVGAAIATNISRYMECAIDIIWTHTHSKKYPFASLLFTKISMPKGVLKKILITSAPLFCNEFLWSSSVTVMNQQFSERGIEVVSAVNIASTASNLFSSFYLSMGIVVSIIVGNALGAGDNERAIDSDRKLIFMSFSLTTFIAIAAFCAAPAVANFYNTTNAVKSLATVFIRVLAVCMPIGAVINACYFTIRSGGKTLITFLFDSCSAWALMVSTAAILVHFTALPIIPIYAITYATETIKLVVGLIMVTKKIWVNNLVA